MGIDRGDDSVDSRYYVGGIRLRPDEKRAIGKTSGWQRKIDLFAVASVELRATCVADNPNHQIGRSIGNELGACMRALVSRSQAQTPADRVLTRPDLPS